MAGRIRIPPYKPLGITAQGVPTGGYYDIDAHAGFFNALPPVQLGLQAAQGAIGVADAVSPYLGSDNEATVKAADTKLGETEQALLFDPQTGYLNLQGQAALQQAPAVLDAYTEAQARTLDTAADDDQRRMLQELADKRLASFNEVVERHGAAQRQSWYDQVTDQRIAAMHTDARLHWGSDALLRRALGTTRAEVRERAERKGWDSPLTEAALRRETSGILVSAISAAVDRDPERARSLRTRYAAVIEERDRAALDVLLAEAQIRERAQAASTEILNATPPDGGQSTPQWRLQQAEAIADPVVRAATIRRLNSAAATAEARARVVGEQALARVLKNGLTDPSQIPLSEWSALDAVRRQAIETRLDHNATGTEPAPNPALIDELATQMTQTPYAFARRDLVPLVGRLPLPQWQRFRHWQVGLRRTDPTAEDEVFAIKRGLQHARKIVPTTTHDESADNFRAELVEEIDTWRRVHGKTPDDADIAGMLQRRLTTPAVFTARTLEADPHQQPEIHLIQNKGKKSGPVVPPRPSSEAFPPEERLKSATTPILPPLGGAPGRVRSSSVKSGPLPTTSPSAPGPRTGLSAPAPRAPTPKGQETFSPTGTATGRTIGGASSVDTNRLPPDPNAPSRFTGRSKGSSPPPDSRLHHEVVQATWKPDRDKPITFSPEVQRFFDRKVIRVMEKDHRGFDDGHRKYNERVRAAMDKYLAGHPEIEPLQMKIGDAEKLYEFAVINNPEVRDFRAKMIKSHQEFKARHPDWEEGQ